MASFKENLVDSIEEGWGDGTLCNEMIAADVVDGDCGDDHHDDDDINRDGDNA